MAGVGGRIDGHRAHGLIEDKKALLRLWVPEMKLAPEQREVEITYRVPEPIMNNLVAGVLSRTNHNAFSQLLTRRILLPTKGRRNPPLNRPELGFKTCRHGVRNR